MEMIGSARRTAAMLFSVLAVDVAAARSETPATFPVTGRVVDARTGEPIAMALVSIREDRLETLTDAMGRFELSSVPAGNPMLYVSTVGYGLVKKPLALHGPLEIEVQLGQEAIKRSEEVHVRVSAFEPHTPDAIPEHTLDNLELRNLSSVLADDVLRSVQTLPGVVSGDDFYADFSVRGSGFENAGLYIDGVLVSSPFHTVRDVNDGYSLMILNGDMVDSVSLVSSAPAARYGDRVGAALAIETRDGSRERRFTRAHLGVAGVSFSSEGPLGKSRNSSWLVAGRKSFLDYVVNRIRDEPSFVLGYHDVQGKLAYRRGAHQLSLLLLHGDALWEENEIAPGPNNLARADATSQIASARWRFSPSERRSLAWNAYATRETGDNWNADDTRLFDSELAQLGLRGDLTQVIGSQHTLEAGVLVRQLRDEAMQLRFGGQPPVARSLSAYDRSAWQPAAYAQGTWKGLDGRLRVTAGGRFDTWSATQESVVSPRASISFALSPRSSLGAATGGYAQFPALGSLFGERGNPELTAERSAHYTLAYEKLLGESGRFRIELYDQEEQKRLFVPNAEFRVEGDRLLRPDFTSRFQNSLAGRSHGVEVFLQRRSANGLSGWISYAFGRTRFRDAVTGERFDSDFDQRHTFNAYLGLRLSDRFGLSTKYRYGSNLPVAGFYRDVPAGYILADERNLVRVPAYSRLDVRASRAFFLKRSKLTLYVEVANVLDRANYRYTGAAIDPASRRVFLERETLFPLLPAASLTIEF